VTPATVTSEWIWSRYHMGPQPEDTSASPAILCNRCGREVDWVTRHAVERHGDTDITVIAPLRPEPPGGWKW